MIVLQTNESIERATDIIARGGVVAFRTDTFYGLGADPFNRHAVLRIRQLKSREENKPILILIADASDVDRFIAERPALFDRVCKRYWPGPLTLVGKAQLELPRELTAGTG